MSLFVFLALAAAFLVITVPFVRRRKSVGRFDPGSWSGPRERIARTDRDQVSVGIHLGGDVRWAPEAYPNPHVLIIGGSGSGKTWTMRRLAGELMKHGYRCLLFDFHGDLVVPGVVTYPISLDSEYGVNPLEISLDPEGGGPDPQRFEVVEQLRNAFRPMGGLQLAVLDSCIAKTYARASLVQDDRATWSQPAPHFGDLLAEIERQMAADPKDTRLRGLRAKLSLAFDFRIFSKPQVPITGKARVSQNSKSFCFSKLRAAKKAHA